MTLPITQDPASRRTSCDASLTELSEASVCWAVVRRDVVSTPDGSVEDVVSVLVAEDDVDSFLAAARARGYGAEASRGDAVATLRRDASGTEDRIRVTVRSELGYGPGAWLRSGECHEPLLARARPVDGVPTVSPGDELVDLVLHAVLDLGHFDERDRERARCLLERLRENPIDAGHAAERVQAHLAPALPWETLLAAVHAERWDDLLALDKPLQRRLLAGRRLSAWARRLGLGARNGSANAAAVAEDAADAGSFTPPSATAGGLYGGSEMENAPEQLSRRQIRGSGLLLAGRGLSTGLKFIAELMIVRYLTTDDYGSWTYALSAVIFLRGFATMGLNRAVVRFLPIHLEREERAQFLGVLAFVVASLVLGTAAVVTAFYAFPEWVARMAGAGPEQSLDVLFIVILLVPVDTLDDFLTGICAAFTASRTIFVRRYLLSPGLRLVLAIGLVLFDADVTLLAYGYLASGVAGLVYYAYSVAQEMRSRGLLDGSLIRDMSLPVRRILAYTVPVMAADWCGILLTTTGPLMLGYYSDMSAVALFQVVVPLVTLIQLVSQSFTVLFEPAASRLFARDDQAGLEKLYWRAAVWVAVLTFPAFAASFTAAEPLSVLLFGERYRAAAPILSFLAMGAFVESILGFNAPTLRVVGELRGLLVVNLVSAVSSVALHAMLIPRYGALGAGIATGIAWSLYAVLKQIALWRGAGVRPFDRMYSRSYGTIAVATLALAGLRITRPDDVLLLATAVIIASMLVVRQARGSLSITHTFPELGRFKLLKAMLG